MPPVPLPLAPVDPDKRAVTLMKSPEYPALFEAFLADVLIWRDGFASDDEMDNALRALLVTLLEMVSETGEIRQ